MNINFKKIKSLQKERGLSIIGLCRLTGISRATFWKWEKGEFNPPETKIRKLADVLNISVSEISDLTETVSKSEHHFGDIIDSWLSLSDMDNTERQHTVSNLLNGISKLNKDLSQATIIIKALMSSFDVMFYIKDSNLNYVTVSESFLKNINTEISQYSIKGKNDYDIFPDNEASINNKLDIEVLSTGTEITNHESFIPGTRKKSWGLISKRPIFDKHSKIIGIIGTFIDITERKKSEDKKNLLEKAIESMGPALSIFDLNSGEFLYINQKAVEKQSGYPVEKFYGKKGKDFYVNEFTHPEDRKIHSTAKEITKWPKSREKIYRIVRADKTIRWIQTFDSYIKLMNKRFIIGLSQDVTENKIAEENSSLLQSVLENTEQILWQLDSETFETVNISGCLTKLTGYTASYFLGKKDYWLNMLSVYEQVSIRHLVTSKAFFKNDKTFNFRINTKENKTKIINCKFIENKKSSLFTFLLKEN